MKAVRLVTLGFLAGLFLTGGSSGPSKRDSFLRVDLDKFADYRRIWAAKLEVTAFDCGRFVSLPPFDPESSVSMYSYKSDSGLRKYRITYILAADNMWQASDGVKYPEKAKSIRTTRVDLDMPESTALLLRNVWLRILQGDHPTESTTPRDRIPIDSPHFEWSLQRSNAPTLRVQDNFYVHPTPVAKLLEDLSDVTLPAYCKAEPSKRPTIVRQIEAQASALLKLSQ